MLLLSSNAKTGSVLKNKKCVITTMIVLIGLMKALVVVGVFLINSVLVSKITVFQLLTNANKKNIHFVSKLVLTKLLATNALVKMDSK